MLLGSQILLKRNIEFTLSWFKGKCLSIESIVNILVGLLTIIAFLSPLIYKAVRSSIMEEVVEKDKSIIKYIGDINSQKLKEYEEKNEEIRQERQIRYGDQLSSIRSYMANIENLLRQIESDMKKYGEVTQKNSWEIENIKKELETKENKKT